MPYIPGEGQPPGYVQGTPDLLLEQSVFTDGVPQTYADLHSINFVSFKIGLQYIQDPSTNSFIIAPATESVQQAKATGDHISADTYWLTNGDDDIAMFGTARGLNVYGERGNDSIASSPTGLYGLYMDGGGGNDTLHANAPAMDRMLGGDGNDTFYLENFAASSIPAVGDKATGGLGADTFVFGNLTSDSSFICDFQAAGADHDTLDLSQALGSAGYSYGSFADAVAAGTIGVTFLEGYTYLAFDTNADHVPDHEFAHMKGVFTPDTWGDFIV